jgi:putative transposase
MGKGTSSYRIGNQNALYFITFSTVEWVDVFTKREYKEVLIDSFRHCQDNKGLELLSWCIMSNHIHFIGRAKEDFELSSILRDFKRHTSKTILNLIQESRESRKDWMLKVFKEAGASNSKNTNYQLWRNDNHPIELNTTAVIDQKMNYIHQNPVEEGYVENAQDYLYSSARDYASMKGKLKIIGLE